MSKKIISVLLVISFLNLLGCASPKFFTVSEYRQNEGKDDKPDEIYVITKDGQEYHIREPIIIFENDTLHVKGKSTNYFKQRRFQEDQQVDRKFAFSDMESIQTNIIIFSGTSFLLVLAICGCIYLVIYAATFSMDWSSQ